jgi:ABC-type uncharacterized transport system substrate-binding protein
MSKKAFGVLLVCLGFATVHLAEAQQPKKVPRIGHLGVNSPSRTPARIEAFINLKAAKEIGLTIPPNVLARADKVIK